MPFKGYYIPSGTKNLSTLFPSINWRNVQWYAIHITTTGNDIVLPRVYIKRCGDIRIHFRNYDGMFDAINFNRPKIVHEHSSKSYQRGLDYPLVKTRFQNERFDVRANDTYECTTSCYSQEKSEWLQELFDSTTAFIEWDGAENQPASYIPIVILDGTFVKQDAFDAPFEAKIQFKLSNEIYTIRN